MVIVESAPWRIHSGAPAKLRKKIRAYIEEAAGRWCVNHAQLVIVTQEEYRRTLLSQHPDRAHVIPASWLDEENILAEEEAAEAWRIKNSENNRRLKLLFAGRLHPSKGVCVVLNAMRLLNRENALIDLHILGTGELIGECRAASKELTGVPRISVMGTVPYGPAFFRILGSYHAIVVPSFSDEQPRIVYDAFSQAVPVLASATPGLLACVHDGQTGKIVDENLPANWAALFRWGFEHRDELGRMGKEGLKTARGTTHRDMHEKRWRLLLQMLGNTAAQ